ncbi:MAG TPA: AsmA family protein [Acetobacteraceae bacterium]|nr:AsmA family protein [Acetobacteraceae bacterium]
MTRQRSLRLLAFVGTPVVLVVALILLWNWDWFIPFVDARASAAIGRRVTITHLHVRLGGVTRVVADGVTIANPTGFPQNQPPLATAQHLGVAVNVLDYIHGRGLVIPQIDLAQPVVSAVTLADGRTNERLSLGTTAVAKSRSVSANPQIGQISIEAGRVHFVDPKLRADFQLGVATRKGALPAAAAPAGTAAEAAAARRAAAAEGAQIVVDARGTYAGQPVTGHLIGGALLSLRSKQEPYPIDVRLANGPTHVTIVGTVQNPLAFAGANVKLALAGPDMALLYPLTGFPIPQTPAYHVTGDLAYSKSRIRFDNFAGVVGTSDLEGSIAEAPGDARPDVTMDLHSRRVNLVDLGGFIGTTPGKQRAANMTPQERAQLAREKASPHLLPTTPIDIPKLNKADIHLKYAASHIAGRAIPFDSLAVVMDVVGGRIDLHPVRFGIGRGHMGGTVVLTPESVNQVAANADVNFDQVDLARVLASAGVKGAGLVNGRATIRTTGNSVATFLGNGRGGVSLYLTGGNLSALIVDLSGLEFGNALLSALGMPRQTELRCFVADLALANGSLQTRALLADTGEAVIHVTGGVDLKNEAVQFRIRTRPKHFSIGSLPAPILISGTLKHPGISVGVKELGARGGIAAALGFLAGPLALLPTIQLGTGPTHQCGDLVAESRSAARSTPGRIAPARK